MQCPFCGYEGIADESCFCPRCRYQFRVFCDEVIPDRAPLRASPEHDSPSADDRRFSYKEIRFIKVQLLQPAVLLMLGIAAGIYAASAQVRDLSITAGGYTVAYGAVLCLILGVTGAWIFYRIMVFTIERG